MRDITLHVDARSPAFEHKPARTAEQRTAAAIDETLEKLATACNGSAVTSQDQRWNRAALALLGARREFRDLMHDDDRHKGGS